MLWKMARQTLIATTVIGALAAAWQLAAGPGMPPSTDNQTQIEREHYDDD